MNRLKKSLVAALIWCHSVLLWKVYFKNLSFSLSLSKKNKQSVKKKKKLAALSNAVGLHVKCALAIEKTHKSESSLNDFRRIFGLTVQFCPGLTLSLILSFDLQCCLSTLGTWNESCFHNNHQFWISTHFTFYMITSIMGMELLFETLHLEITVMIYIAILPNY